MCEEKESLSIVDNNLTIENTEEIVDNNGKGLYQV
jgi:hypothetical protein